MKKQIALIPAYEPDQMLPALLCEIRAAGFEAVLVDDGSGSAYAGIFRECAGYAAVLTHTENKGKGRALKTGLEYINRHFDGGYTVVTLDADGQHRVADAQKVCETAREHPDSLILGSRKLNKRTPARSKFGNMITRLVYRLSTGLRVKDTQTGLRAFDSRLVPTFLEISGERYEYEMNVLLECARRKIPILETEIETIYYNNNAASHFDTLRDSCRVYREILKFSASSFAGFLVDYGLYSLFSFLTASWGSAGLWVSNIAARVVSASVNYLINRKLVFKSKKNAAKSALQYFLLAAAILAGNTLMLNFLAGNLGINRFAAKICTEILFFVVSWLIQRFLIFRGKDRDKSLQDALPSDDGQKR